MRCTAKYNPLRDVCAVERTGYFDLAAVNAESVIPAGIPMAEERFNGIEDPNSIGYRPRDQFEAAQAAKVVTGYKAPSDDSAKE